VKLVVFGASGGCGSHFVRLAAAGGHEVTAVVRPTTVYAAPRGVRTVRGDVLEASFVAGVIPGHEAVMSGLGMRYRHPWARRESPDDFTSRATRNIVGGMSAGVRRISVISAAGVAESRAAVNVPLRFLIATSNVGIAYADLERVEQILRESGLDWQAVRPTTLSSRRARGVRLANSFPFYASIPRESVAAFMLSELEKPAFTQQTPTITGA
jgi:putative NADH-flavin reductase